MRAARIHASRRARVLLVRARMVFTITVAMGDYDLLRAAFASKCRRARTGSGLRRSPLAPVRLRETTLRRDDSGFVLRPYGQAFEILISAVPIAKRVAVLWNPGTPSHTPGLKAVEESARMLLVQLQTVVARTGADLERAFSAMAREHAHAVLVLSFGPYSAARRRIAELAIRYRLPTMFALRDHVGAGGLMSYGPDYSKLVRRGAVYVDKILRGAKPACDLPAEQPSKFEFLINLKTSKALGLTIPPSLLARADCAAAPWRCAGRSHARAGGTKRAV
jgi:hypothetical protein